MILALTIVAALAAALMGGVFFAFSSFVMRALDRLAAPDAVRAMQAINVAVFHPSFMALFFGTPVVCLGLAAHGVAVGGGDGAGWRIAGSVVYLLGSFGVTIAANVPRNDALARVDADADDAAQRWRAYRLTWTAWNHVRTLACAGAAGVFVAGLVAC